MDHPIWAVSPPEKIDKNGMAGGNETAWLCRFLLSVYKGAAGQEGRAFWRRRRAESRVGTWKSGKIKFHDVESFPEGGKQRRKSDIVRNKIPKTGIFAFAFYREIAIIGYR